MIIGAKSGLNKDQLKDRQSKGAKYIELYTSYKDFEDIDTKQIKENLEKTELTVYAVHSPMENEFNSHCCLGVSDKKERETNLNLIKQSIKLAAEVSKYKNPIVIAHVGGTYILELHPYGEENLKEQIELLKEDIYIINDFIKKNYPKVILGIENHCAFIVSNNNVIGVNYGKDFDIAEIVDEINLPNIKTVLDVCHAQSVCNLDIVYGVKNRRTVLDFLEAFKSNLGLIHLSNVKDFGETRYKHGLPYETTRHDQLYLKSFFNKLKEINYYNPITIETNEPNLNNAINYQTTMETINIVLKK